MNFSLKVSIVTLSISLCFVNSEATATAIGGNPFLGSVSETVTQINANTWDYQYTVSNTSTPISFIQQQQINQFALPTFSDSNITNITSPAGWTSSTSSSNQFSGATSALSWMTSANNVPIGGSLSGFGFTSTYAPVKGPYSLTFGNGFTSIGDPGIPGSPLTIAAGYSTPTSFSVAAVPEPETYGMMLAGLGLIGFMVRRKKSV